MKNVNFYLTILAISIFTYACQNSSSKSEADSNSENKEETTTYENSDHLKMKDLVFAWVDKLNIRSAPNLKGTAITAVNSNDALEFTGERSKEKETVVLRGKPYEDNWLKVKTPDDKEGWVFGGAVKQKDEKKGNDLITADKFHFEHFGNFDLSEWKKTGTRTEGDEVDYTVATYEKGGQVLEVTDSDMGEMHYGYSYKLMDSDKKVLKTRDFSFSAGGGKPFILTENVKDYTSNPPTEFNRSQETNKHFYDMNERPVMANGPWNIKSMGGNESKEDVTLAAKGTENSTPKADEEKFQLGSLSMSDCGMTKENDCPCVFRTGKSSNGQGVLVSDGEDKACFSIDGKIVSIPGGVQDNGFLEAFENSQKGTWVELNERGDDFLFGEKFNLGDDWETPMNKLVEVLLVMPEFPDDLPRTMNGTVGMGHTANVRDLWNDALTKAKAERAKGNYGTPLLLINKNADYEVKIKGRISKMANDDISEIQGTMEVKSKDGKVISSQKVWGDCGC